MMKNKIITLVIAAMMMSCGGETNEVSEATSDHSTVDLKIGEKRPKVNSDEKSTTHLCKINGKDWGYTKASGILTQDRKTNVRKAIFTFKKKTNSKSESVQVEMDADTGEITRIIIDQDLVNKKGKMQTALYSLVNEKSGYSGSIVPKGSVDVSDEKNGSGSAQFVGVNKYEHSQFAEEHHFAEVTELKFSGIGFSDLNKVKKQLESLSGSD